MTDRWAVLSLTLLWATAVAGELLTVPPPSHPDALGRGIQRSLTLAATSTPERRKTVKVLFYGQSITQQEWWQEVADSLRQRYPNAHWVIENRAIGGFSSQYLWRTAEADLYPFYPDLVIFHVYGSHLDYETIIRRCRERTTAEILMVNDHATRPTDLTEPTDPAGLTPQQWSAFMNHKFLPEIAAKYGCGFADIRGPWKRYLTEHRLEPAALLRDGVHLNDDGNRLMAALLKPYFVYRPELAADWRGLVTDQTDLTWRDGRLTVTFEGNRVALVTAPGPRPDTPTKVLIDGRSPASFPSCYATTRVRGYPQVGWPCVMRVMADQPRVVETWTARILTHDDEYEHFTFAVSGSVTGPDGEGHNKAKFVSRSGRVVIEPEDWALQRSMRFTKAYLPADFTITWQVSPLFVDEHFAPAVTDPTLETVTVLAQNLPPGHHTLELRAGADGPPPLAAVRAWQPPRPATD